MSDWMKHKLESRFHGNIYNLRYEDDTLMAESKELNNLLMKAKEESEKVSSTFRKLRSRHLVPSLHGK